MGGCPLIRGLNSHGRGEEVSFPLQSQLGAVIGAVLVIKKKEAKKKEALNYIKEQRSENVFACDCLTHLRGYKSQRSLKETATET